MSGLRRDRPAVRTRLLSNMWTGPQDVRHGAVCTSCVPRCKVPVQPCPHVLGTWRTAHPVEQPPMHLRMFEILRPTGNTVQKDPMGELCASYPRGERLEQGHPLFDANFVQAALRRGRMMPRASLVQFALRVRLEGPGLTRLLLPLRFALAKDEPARVDGASPGRLLQCSDSRGARRGLFDERRPAEVRGRDGDEPTVSVLSYGCPSLGHDALAPSIPRFSRCRDRRPDRVLGMAEAADRPQRQDRPWATLVQFARRGRCPRIAG